MKLVAIGDEIGTSIEEQIESLKLANIKYIEIRKISDKYLWEFSEEEIKEFKDIFDRENIGVITLDSPVGKKPIPYERKKELFEIYLRISKILKNKYIRIFSNLGKNLTEKSIKEELKQYCKKAEDEGIKLIMENERATYAESPVDCLKLISNESNIDILFDPENAFFEGHDIFNAYENSKQRIFYVHLRDFYIDKNMYAPLGKGDLEFEKLIQCLKNDNFNGIISMETHLPMNNSEKTKRELFLDSVKNLNFILKKLNIDVY